jgi:hypothetical protein
VIVFTPGDGRFGQGRGAVLMSHALSWKNNVVAAVVAVVATMTLAGCGPFTETITLKGPTYKPLTASDMPAEILAAAKAAHSLHIVGTMDGSDIDFTFVRGGGVKGTMTVDGATIDMLTVNGTFYVKLTASLLDHEHVKNVPPDIVGKWAKLPPPTDPGEKVLGSYTSFVDGMIGHADEDTYTTHGTSVVSGTTCRVFIDNSDESKIYVAASGSPDLVKIDGGDDETMNFHWNIKASITAPAPSQIVHVPGLDGINA